MQLETKNGKVNLKKIIVIAAVVVALALVIGIFIYVGDSSKLSYDKIYEGVFVGTEDVGGLSVDEAAEKIGAAYEIDKNRIITITCEGKEVTVNLDETGVEVDALKSAEEAYKEGREGSRSEKLKRIKEIKKNKVILPVSLKYDNEYISAKISELANQVDVPERELTVELEGEELVITKGKPGKRIIEENATKQIEEAILDKNALVVELKREDVIPPELTVDYLKNEVCTEPQDATYTIEDHRLTIIDEKVGIKIDMTEAKQIIESTPGDVVRIPAVITQPNVTAEKIEADLFPDLLGTYQTRYNAGDVARSHNLALASEKISEIVLAPDEVFSYNDIVGPRTAERGFREAGVYVGNKVERGLGGGICQVSSTLFNTVVLSDLNIVYRTNHSLPVSYVPLGRDATVSYGSIDFKFSNNTGAPIKIVASAQGGTNVVSIYGIKKNPGRTIEITTECTGTYSPRVEQIEDPTLPVGEVKVEQAGANGSSYVTYKITKENGKTIKTETLTKSSYAAKDRIERIGTMEEVTTEVPPSDGAETPPADTPVATEASVADGGQ